MAGPPPNPELARIIGERLSLLIERDGQTRAGVGHDLRIGYSQIHAWASGRITPGTPYVVILADYFNVSTDYLLGRSDSAKPPRAR